MNVVIVGAGALGSYFGARFIEAGANVTFLVREKRKNQIQQNHILIQSAQGNYTVKKPQLAVSSEDIDQVDLVLVCVKGYHLSGTLDQLKTMVQNGAHVLPILNGMEHISYLQDQLGKDAVIGGLSFIIATLDENGHVIHSSEVHDLIFGPLQSTQMPICKRFEELCSKANINSSLTEQVTAELWKKYTFINAFSGITTAANLSIGEVRKHKHTFRIAEMLLQEMRTLSKAYGNEIPQDHLETAKTQMLHLPNDATSSMHQDRRKGLSLEVEHLHGGALRLGKAAGIDMPYTDTIYSLIKPFENA